MLHIKIIPSSLICRVVLYFLAIEAVPNSAVYLVVWHLVVFLTRWTVPYHVFSSEHSSLVTQTLQSHHVKRNSVNIQSPYHMFKRVLLGEGNQYHSSQYICEKYLSIIHTSHPSLRNHHHSLPNHHSLYKHHNQIDQAQNNSQSSSTSSRKHEFLPDFSIPETKHQPFEKHEPRQGNSSSTPAWELVRLIQSHLPLVLCLNVLAGKFKL